MEHLDTFLAHYPPFDGIGPELLNALVAEVDVRSQASGELVLVEDGLPATGLWVLLTGSMDLVHEGAVIQVLEPGECFGHPSLLTGMAPAFTVRAREPCTCALFGAETGRRALGTQAGAAYVAATMRKRLTRIGHTAHGLLDVGTTPVSAIMRPATFCEGDESVRRAAGRLGEEGISALLVRLADGEIGIVTDADVRLKVVSERVSLDASVATIARAPVPTVPVGQLAIEATVDMLAASTEQVAVLDALVGRNLRPTAIGRCRAIGIDGHSADLAEARIAPDRTGTGQAELDAVVGRWVVRSREHRAGQIETP